MLYLCKPYLHLNAHWPHPIKLKLDSFSSIGLVIWKPQTFGLALLFNSTGEQIDVICLLAGIIGDSLIPSALRPMLRETLNLWTLRLASCYEMTETPFIATVTRSSEILDEKWHIMGRFLLQSSVKIVAEDGSSGILKIGERSVRLELGRARTLKLKSSS
jgi:acyl-CoA synthetase (AMP-forming)/AMP-acid ligase II